MRSSLSQASSLKFLGNTCYEKILTVVHMLFTKIHSHNLLKICRPVLDPIASIFHRLLCGRLERSDSRGQSLDTSPLPGSDSIEANRRRLASAAVFFFPFIWAYFVLLIPSTAIAIL